MEPRAVVEALDVLEHAAARLRPGIEGEVIEPLGLQGMEEALRRCIVETIAGPAHAADHPVLIEELLVVGARVGSAAIAVMHEAGRGATPRDGAVQRLERDGLLGARGGSPPHNPPREGIEEDREEEPALAGPDLSDVREPEVVGASAVKLRAIRFGAAGRSGERRVAMNRNRRAARPRRPSSCISRATRCLPMAYPALRKA